MIVKPDIGGCKLCMIVRKNLIIFIVRRWFFQRLSKKDYKISEDRIQGSMAMHTIVQNDNGDYDIDVGIVFESSNLNGLGPLASRNMVADALKRKTKQFAEEPEVKTSCVRLKYTSTGYHVDFALFKREKDNYKSRR